MRSWCAMVLAVVLALPVWEQGEAAPLRVGVIPINDSLPVYVAAELGYFAAEGLDVRLTPLPSGTRIVEALAGGSLEIGLSATLSILQAVEQGLDLVIVEPAAFARTDSRPVNGLVVLDGAPIAKPADLRGKVVAVNALKNIGYLMVAEYLARGGVSASQVTWQELPVPQMAVAVEQGRVAAANLVEPFLTVALGSGKVRILSVGEDILPGTSVSALFALRPWYEKNGATIDAFDRAFERSLDYCARHPERAREILTKHTRLSPEIALRMNLQLFRPVLLPEDLVGQQDVAKRHRLLQRGVDLDRVVAPSARSR